MATTRFGAWALGALAVLAVGLAAIGLAATIGWWVSNAPARSASGSRSGRREDVSWGSSSGRDSLLASAGIAGGVIAALFVTRAMTGWIYGVGPQDPRTFAGCALLMFVVAALAIYAPVRRAMRVDPVIALRAD